MHVYTIHAEVPQILVLVLLDAASTYISGNEAKCVHLALFSAQRQLSHVVHTIFLPLLCAQSKRSVRTTCRPMYTVLASYCGKSWPVPHRGKFCTDYKTGDSRNHPNDNIKEGESTCWKPWRVPLTMPVPWPCNNDTGMAVASYPFAIAGPVKFKRCSRKRYRMIPRNVLPWPICASVSKKRRKSWDRNVGLKSRNIDDRRFGST
jgi:hypothetical protein